MTNKTSNTLLLIRKHANLFTFLVCWFLVFILYLPSSGCGLEGDFPYWALTVKSSSFIDFVNTKTSALPILYQFSQAITYLFYRLFGVDPLLWHLMHLTLHAVVCLLFFIFSRTVLSDSGIRQAGVLSFFGVLLFALAPHSVEVVVRELCYHYLQAFIFILLILNWMLRFFDTRQVKYAWYAAGIYFVSIFSLEMFYVTPWVLLAVMLYYRVAVCRDVAVLKKAVMFFFIPELLMFLLHLGLLRLLWGNRLAHVGALSLSNPATLFNRPLLYYFHMVFLGRYFPQGMKMKVYDHFSSGTLVVACYAILALLVLLIAVRFSKLGAKAKAAVLFGALSVPFVLLATPLDFAPILHIIGDRYLYIPSAFFSMAFVLLLAAVPFRVIGIVTYFIYLGGNIFLTVKTNLFCYHSAAITTKLLNNVPPAGNRKILLLNLPATMNGSLMIRAVSPSEFKMMNNMFAPAHKIANEVYDVSAYNMQQPGDGAHVAVANDSMLHVTLNQWGSWWWYGDLGAYSYENSEYKLNLVDAGHWYELTLKHPASDYLILYQVGDQWKVVDWSKKNVEQY